MGLHFATYMHLSLLAKWTAYWPAFSPVGSVAIEIFIPITIYNNPQFTAAVDVIHLHACPNAFPLLLKRNLIMGGLRQDSSIVSSPSPASFLTNGNILILSFIPQDWKYNFMITSLLEPCLIIPNYAARHLVHSVGPTMQPERQLARRSVCVQSPWYHPRGMLPPPHLNRLQRRDLCCCINNTARYCPGGSLLCVSSSSLSPPICYAVYPNMEHVVPSPWMWWMHRRSGKTCTYCIRNRKTLERE